MPAVLLAWIGFHDLDASVPDARSPGPIGRAFDDLPYDGAVLISDHDDDRTRAYAEWLKRRTRGKVKIRIRKEHLGGPTLFRDIYPAAVRAVEEARSVFGPDAELTFHTSPGTPTMSVVWMLLSKTRFPARLLESSPQTGTTLVDFPFEIAAEFVQDLLRVPDRQLAELSAGVPGEDKEFEAIVHRSPVMRTLLTRSRRIAPHDVPVLIEGESGTGKELLAAAIHGASPRAARAFVAVNCGAIPQDLVESELFGHAKGAFTGAVSDRKGHFEAAHGGTLFLDEIGELPLRSQVKLLRILQEGSVVRVGESRPVPVEVRVVAATNRNLLEEVAAGRFRSDLYYRLAVAVLHLPPLRERPGDVGLLHDHHKRKINEARSSVPGYRVKSLSPGARNVFLNHSWPGNVRELHNTLLRAAVWTDGPVIRPEDAREALVIRPQSSDTAILGRPLSGGLDLRDLLETVAEHIARAILEMDGVHCVDVVVHKPQAPISQPFGDVSVTICRSK